MFDPGTKVVVLASSIKKGTTGPRKGSVGYVNNKTSSGSNTAVINDITRLATSITNVTFLRYGFEKSNRRETKTVCNFIPIPLKTKNCARKDTIDDTIQKMESSSFVSKIEYALKQVYMHNTIDKMPIVILGVPDCCGSSLVDCSHNEFCCWFESMLVNNTNNINRIHSLYEGTSHHIGSNIDLELIHVLLDCVYSIDQRNSFYESVKNDKTIRENIITTLRKICIIADKRIVDNVNFVGVTSSFLKSNINYSNFYNYFSGNIFTVVLPTLIDIAKKEMNSTLNRSDLSDNRISQYKKAIIKGGELIDNINIAKKHTSELALSLLNA